MATNYNHLMKDKDDHWLRLEAERIDQQLLLDKDKEYIMNCNSPMSVRLPPDSQTAHNTSDRLSDEVDVETFRQQLNNEAEKK